MAASSNEYIREAVDTLEVISQDEQKRLEYNARQKALWDYNTLMAENYTKGMADGEASGIAKLLAKMKAYGLSDSQIQAILNS